MLATCAPPVLCSGWCRRRCSRRAGCGPVWVELGQRAFWHVRRESTAPVARLGRGAATRPVGRRPGRWGRGLPRVGRRFRRRPPPGLRRSKGWSDARRLPTRTPTRCCPYSTAPWQAHAFEGSPSNVRRIVVIAQGPVAEGQTTPGSRSASPQRFDQGSPVVNPELVHQSAEVRTDGHLRHEEPHGHLRGVQLLQ